MKGIRRVLLEHPDFASASINTRWLEEVVLACPLDKGAEGSRR